MPSALYWIGEEESGWGRRAGLGQVGGAGWERGNSQRDVFEVEGEVRVSLRRKGRHKESGLLIDCTLIILLWGAVVLTCCC